jgi:hypothetical protein
VTSYLQSVENSFGDIQYWRISFVAIGNGLTLGMAYEPSHNNIIPWYPVNNDEKEAVKSMINKIKSKLNL